LSLVEDLRVDSLDLLEILMAVEDTFRVKIPDADRPCLRTWERSNLLAGKISPVAFMTEPMSEKPGTTVAALESQRPPMASPRRDPLVPFDYSRSHLSPVYCCIARPLFRLFNLFYFSRCLVRWVENVPLHGPAILALNHPAVADIPFVGACISHRRFAHFMSEEELFLNRFPFKLLASLITPLGAFPVDRRLPVDRRSISYAVDRLAEGSLLILAPEGGTERGWGLLPFRPGFVLLALLARERLLQQGKPGEIKIVPAAVLYRETPRGLHTKRAMRFRARAGLSVGKPFSLENFIAPGKKKQEIMDEVTAFTRARVEELLRQLEKDLK